MRYEYKNVRKDVFVDKYEQFDIMKDYKNFFIKMEELKLYMVKFEEDGIMNPKLCLSNCVIKGNERQPIIIIIYDEYTFFTNNRV